MTGHCENCGAAVSTQYVRVFAREEDGHVEACPRCPDRTRVNGHVRETKTTRNTGRAVREEAMLDD